jgi:hypothetical protein
MRKEYDFSKMVGRKNPYAKKLKKQVTIRLGEDVIAYFRSLGEETGIPYQSLINLYLRDCVVHNRKPSMEWTKASVMVRNVRVARHVSPTTVRRSKRRMSEASMNADSPERA